MSFIISCHVQEGVVMASDSRLTISNTRNVNGEKIFDNAVSQSDTNYKTFLAPNNVGISYFGQATIDGIPISGFIDAFINETLRNDTTDIEDIPNLLVTYFQNMEKTPDTGFHVGGYKQVGHQRIQMLWRVFALTGQIENVVPDQQIHGVIWDGEQDVMIRIINNNIHFKKADDSYAQMEPHDIPFQMFTLQDAIDFCSYAVRTTSDTMKFQLRYKTVGGPIDILVITPSESFWVARKQLQP